MRSSHASVAARRGGPGAKQGGEAPDEGNCSRVDNREGLTGVSRRRADMVSGCVLDFPIATAWCFTGETTPESGALRQSLTEQHGIAPRLWHAETTNLLLMAERRQRIKPAM